MTKVLVVGCGDLGGEVAQLLAASGHEVIGARISGKALANNIPCLQVDVTTPSSLSPIKLVKPTIVIYCVAANAQNDDNYQRHYVEGLRNVLSTQETNANLKHVFFISSTRVYGQTSSQVLDEDMVPAPSDFGGERLLEAEGLLKNLQCGASAIRLSGIYGPGRLYLVNMAKDPNRWPKVNKWTNRIYRDDAARFIAFLCEKAAAGEALEDCYIGTDDMPTLQYDVLTWLAKQLDLKVPTLNNNTQVGGKRLSNKRMHASGYRLQYVNYQLGYAEILKREIEKNG